MQDIFEGILKKKVKCFGCNKEFSRNEPFLDLPIDLRENTSLNYCLNKFGIFLFFFHKIIINQRIFLVKTEILKDADKFDCDNCKSK